MNIAYLFQNISTRFDRSRAEQLHIIYTLRGLQDRGHNAKLVALFGRRVICTDDIEAVTSNRLKDLHFGRLGISGANWFRLFESGSRRAQTILKVPYFALFDGFRLYDACLNNLNGIELLHERYNVPAMAGALASKKLKVPYVVEVNADILEQRRHKGTPDTGLWRIYGHWTTQLCFKRASKIICVSEDLKEHLHHKWQVGYDRLIVLPCAANTNSFGGQQNPTQTREKMGLKDEQIVVWVGGFYVWHDLSLLIDAFKIVVEEKPKTRLILVGDGETKSQIEEMVASYGLSDSVILIGAVSHDSIPALLSMADVTVSPYPSLAAKDGGTGTPLKIFEYMAAGKPVVASATDQASSVIRNDENGFLVEPDNPVAFGQAIIRILSDQDLQIRLGRNARKLAVEKYSWENYAKQLEDIYQSVL